MYLHQYYADLKQAVQTVVVGAGGFGRSFIAQGLKTPLMDVRVAVDLDAADCARVFAAVGVAPESIRICRSTDEARQAWDEGAWIAAERLEDVLGLPLDVVVEATGHPEAGARHARLAIDADKHVALVSKEVDSVIGPVLAHRAALRGKVVTPVDGDQPSLLIGLISWAEVLGLEIIAAGKSSEYDFVFDPVTCVLSSERRSAHLPEFADLMQGDDILSMLAARSRCASAFPQRAVPDLCELQVVAASVGMRPDVPGMHMPIAQIGEVAEIFATEQDGGLLSGSRRLDVFHCLRRPNEVSFAGGVFVTVRCNDVVTWELLEGKGHVLNRSRSTAMLYLPRHLLGVEAATSVMSAGMGVSSGKPQPQPVLDLVPIARQNLPAGTVLTAHGHHHSIDHVTAELRAAGALKAGAPLPFYLAANRRLVREVKAGAPICLDDVALDETSVLLQLRREQDAHFFGG